VRSGGRLCGLPLDHVVEIMRPLPIESIRGAPAFVRGISVVRGAPIPIVDLRVLLGDDQARPLRLVALRIAGDRRVGLLVDRVVGIRDRLELSSDRLPPLLRDTGDLVDELGRLDGQLLSVLQTANLVAEELYQRLVEPSR
jgi:purine-binding chemotaxis protein CheW